MVLTTSSEEVIFHFSLFVCFSDISVSETIYKVFMKFHGMVGHNPGTGRLHFE